MDLLVITHEHVIIPFLYGSTGKSLSAPGNRHVTNASNLLSKSAAPQLVAVFLRRAWMGPGRTRTQLHMPPPTSADAHVQTSKAFFLGLSINESYWLIHYAQSGLCAFRLKSPRVAIKASFRVYPLTLAAPHPVQPGRRRAVSARPANSQCWQLTGWSQCRQLTWQIVIS